MLISRSLAPPWPGVPQSIVGTLLALVEAHGFAPNGLRRYYLNRSQPPLLSQVGGRGGGLSTIQRQQAPRHPALHAAAVWVADPEARPALCCPRRPQMVAAVHAAAPDAALLQRALAALQREHSYWTSGPKLVVLRGPDGRQHRLSRYWADWDQPRPESYRCVCVAGLGGLYLASVLPLGALCSGLLVLSRQRACPGPRAFGS